VLLYVTCSRSIFNRLTSSFNVRIKAALGSSLTRAWHTICFARSAYLNVLIQFPSIIKVFE
jgi:hypothetical protein